MKPDTTQELGQAWSRGLERLCEDESCDHIIHDAGISGLERIDVSISRYTYEPHRHDTYGIGVTLEGVQSFSYRGARRISTPGKCIILHPDEVHDGAAGDATGLHYRMLYLDPALLSEALSPLGEALPFVSTPVVDDPELQRLCLSVLDMDDTQFSGLQVDGFVAELAPILLRLAHAPRLKSGAAPVKHMHAVRDYLDANRFDHVNSGALENVAGLDRFTIARQFRRQFGTSPHRYLLMRRLASARERISFGQPLADIAADTGFADQAHFSRHFKKAYGMTPGRWAQLAVRTG